VAWCRAGGGRSVRASAIARLVPLARTIERSHVIQPVAIALLIAVVLGIVWRAAGNRRFLGLALLWAAYAAYEYLMYARVLCTGECNIRVDLLFIYPALLGSTLWPSIAAAIRAVKRRRGAAGDA
jgi:hypothetical protein